MALVTKLVGNALAGQSGGRRGVRTDGSWPLQQLWAAAKIWHRAYGRALLDVNKTPRQLGIEAFQDVVVVDKGWEMWGTRQ